MGETYARLGMKGCVLLLCCGLLNGCAFARGNYGDQFNMGDVEAIKKGVSTRADVAAHLGAPDRIIEVNGHEIFQYYRYDIKSGLVIIFSRTNVRSEDLFVIFNSNGVVDEVIFGKPKRPIKFQVWPFGD